MPTTSPVQAASALPVYVINLAGDRTRWEGLVRSAEIHARNFTLHRIEAVDGRTAGSERPGADLSAFLSLQGRAMLPGEYGCYRSHMKALEVFLESGASHGLILEDDVLFLPDSAARIEAVLAALPDGGVVKLVNHRTALMIALGETAEGDTIGRTLHGPQGSAAAYLVSREGARRLLAGLATMTRPWDVALELFWVHGASVFSTEDDVLGFSEHRQASTIATQGYGEAKLPWYRRFGAASVRFKDYFSRLTHVMRRPREVMRGTAPDPFAFPLPLWGELATGLALLAFISAVWIETDAYRYAGLVLVGAALLHYARTDFWDYRARLRLGWVAFLCFGWAFYVAGRFAWSYLLHRPFGMGSSEGIYLFPLLYPTFGYALLIFVRRPFVLASVFLTISAMALAFGIDYRPAFGARTITLLHNNPIHASVAAGLILLCTVPFALHVLKRRDLKPWLRLGLAALAAATFFLALLAVTTLWSKGVWLALAIALPLLAVIIVATEMSQRGRAIAVAAVFVAIAAGVGTYPMLRSVAGPTVEMAFGFLQDMAGGDGISAMLKAEIADPSTPHADRERLMLWANGLAIWKSHPLFGAGIAWLHEWQARPYQETPFRLLHNGFLEIAVRYGILGLAFYAVLFGWALRSVWRAARAGLVDMTAFHAYAACLVFFAATLLTNSNNRLAIGESFMWFAASFGFFCFYRLQRAGVALRQDAP